MTTNLIMVYAEGFMFIGKRKPIRDDELTDAVQLTVVNVTTRDGIMAVPVLRKIGAMKLNIESYPNNPIDSDNKLYGDYIKLITGIDVPDVRLN